MWPSARVAHVLAGAYIVLMMLSRPALPGNIRLADLVFPALAVVVLWTTRQSSVFHHLTPLDWCVLAIVVTTLPSLLVTTDLRVSLVAFAKRAYVAALYVVFAVYFERFGVRRPLLWLVRVAIVTSAVCLAAALAYMAAGVYSPFLGYPMALPYIGTVLRLWGGTYSAAMFGNYLTFVWPLACAFAWESARRGWWMAGLAVLVLAMGLAFSHALAGFAAATLVLAWPLATSPWRRVIRAVAVTATAAIIIAMNAALIMTVREVTVARDHNRDIRPAEYAYAFQPPEGADRVTVAVSYNPMSYYLIKKVAFRAFMEHPLTGIGLGTFHQVTARANDAGVLHDHYRAIDPHMTLLGALAETGVFGGLGVAALFVVALFTRPRTSDVWMVRALQAAIVGIAINSVNVDALNFRFLWIGLAALRALDETVARTVET
jgi:hypothetical protein